RVVDDSLGQEIIEATFVAALGGCVVDFKKRLRFGAAHRLIVDSARGQDTCAPGGIKCVQRAREMNATPRGRAFAGDDTVAHYFKGSGRGIAAGNFGWLKRADRFG